MCSPSVQCTEWSMLLLDTHCCTERGPVAWSWQQSVHSLLCTGFPKISVLLSLTSAWSPESNGYGEQLFVQRIWACSLPSIKCCHHNNFHVTSPLSFNCHFHFGGGWMSCREILMCKQVQIQRKVLACLWWVLLCTEEPWHFLLNRIIFGTLPRTKVAPQNRHEAI